MEAVAKLRNCPMSARKMRLAADLVRNKPVGEALSWSRGWHLAREVTFISSCKLGE